MARINVIFKPTGQRGTVEDFEYDPNIYSMDSGTAGTSAQVADQPAQPEQPTEPANKMPWYKEAAISALPTVGAIGGGIVGGVAAGPFGAIPLAAAGGASMEALRQRLMNENVDVSKMRNQGALGAVGEGSGLLIGAAAKPVLNAVSKTIPGKIMNTVFKEPIKATKAAIGKGTTLGEEALARGEKGGAEGIFKKAITKINELEDGLQQILMGSNKKVPISSVKKTVQPLIDSYRQAGNEAGATAIEKRLIAIELESGKRVPIARANEIKRSLYDEVGRAYGSQSTEGAEGLKATARGFKEIIGEVPGVEQINKDLSYYGRVRDSMVDTIARERNNLLSLSDILPAGVGLGVGGLPGAAISVGAKKALGSTGGKTFMAQGLKATEGLEKGIPAVSRLAGQGIVRGTNALFAPEAANGTDQQTQNQLPHISDSSVQTPQSQGLPEIQPQYTLAELADWYNRAVMGGDTAGATRIKQMFDMQKSQATPTKKTETQQAREDVGYLAATAVKQLKSGVKTGPFLPKIEEMKAIVNKGDQPTLEFNNTIAQIKGALAKARAGTSFTPNEERLLNKYTPNIGDSTQQLQTKLEGLQDFFNRYKGQNIVPDNQYGTVPEITL